MPSPRIAVAVGALLLTALAVVNRSAFGRPPASGPGACSSTAALDRQWGGTGAWRRLAPYPVAREASPTDSVGVWLERWHMPNGTTELRRVSAALTTVAVSDADGCSVRTTFHRRTF